MKYLIPRVAFGAFVIALSLLSFGSQQAPAFGLIAQAQTQPQLTDDQAKIDIYTRFVNNRLKNDAIAYQAAKDYLQKYPKDDDQYTKYLRRWVVIYERDERKRRLPQLIYDEKNFAEGYRVGKQVLEEEPENLPALIHLGYGAYLATTAARNEAFNRDAMAYAKKAIQSIEAGKTPEDWKPFKDKDDTLAHLYYTIAFLSLKNSPDQAIDPLIRTVQFETDLKKAPSTYYFLAVAYESGPYKTMAAAFQTVYAGKPETPDSKLALEKLNVVVDRIIDAYARAIAAAGSEPANARNKTEWLDKLTQFYKFRHEGSDVGLNDLIASALSRPLPPKP
jgi:tetratricopeptide (TPR) repeat protein